MTFEGCYLFCSHLEYLHTKMIIYIDLALHTEWLHGIIDDSTTFTTLVLNVNLGVKLKL